MSNRLKMTVLMVLSITFLAVAVGCGQVTPTPALTTSTAIPTPGLESGWVPYENQIEGFTIALPPTWKQIEMDAKTLDASMKVVKESNPQMATILEGQARNLIASGFKFFGFDMAPEAVANGLTTSVNVMKQRLGAEVSLEFFVQVNLGQMENMTNVVKPIVHQRTKLMIGDAEEIKYTINMAMPNNQTVVFAVTQYLFIKGKDAFVITLATTTDQAEKYAPVFQKIAYSFRLAE